MLARCLPVAAFLFSVGASHLYSVSCWAQPATTVQLPTFGVAVDAEGVLKVKTFVDRDGRLTAARRDATLTKLADDIRAPSKMRKVSLVQLERAVRRQVALGKSPDEVMRHLAGLQRIQYVFYYPERRDIVIAGPAEGWVEDLSGRAVGLTTGRPVLLLEDLITALRAFGPASRSGLFVGCTISPDADGLRRFSEFQRTIPRTIPQNGRDAFSAKVARGMRDSLGQANIRVYGVSDRTHLAQVMLEADYRMKLIGVGLEPPPTKMATFIGMLKRPQHQMLQRWWFTPNYDCVKVTEDHLGMELVGEGVQLLGEDKLIGPDGKLAAKGVKANKASELFTKGFTKKYAEISAHSPVFAQLRNMVDLLVAAAFIRQEDYYAVADWSLGVFADEEGLPVETLPAPKHVDCAINVLWKGNRMLAPAGGGVSIRADLALQAERLLPDSEGTVADAYRQMKGKPASDRWWWD